LRCEPHSGPTPRTDARRLARRLLSASARARQLVVCESNAISGRTSGQGKGHVCGSNPMAPHPSGLIRTLRRRGSAPDPGSPQRVQDLRCEPHSGPIVEHVARALDESVNAAAGRPSKFLRLAAIVRPAARIWFSIACRERPSVALDMLERAIDEGFGAKSNSLTRFHRHGA
jgi:hypothetical protein